MMIITGCIALISYLLFVMSFLRIREIRLSLLFGFFLLFSIQYGPHTFFLHDKLRLSASLNLSKIEIIYNILMVALYLTLAILLFFSRKKYLSGNDTSSQTNTILSTNANQHFIVGLALLLIVVSIWLQKGTEITVTHIRYLLGSYSFSYKEIRRILFVNTSWYTFSAFVRYSISPVIFVYLLHFAIQSKILKKTFYIIILVLYMSFSSIHLSKHFFIYYSLLLLSSFLMKKPPASIITTKNIRKYIIALPFVIILFLTFVYGLYLLQYRTSVSDGMMVSADLIDTLLFRFFFASSDALRIWIDYFVVHGEPVGFSIIGKVCHYLSDQCINPNDLLPRIYLARTNTTLQAGFLGTALGFSGLYWVLIFIIIVYFLFIVHGYVLYRLKNNEMINSFSLISFLSAYGLSSSELHTALLSGGIVSSILLIYFFEKIPFRRVRKNQ